MKIVKCTRKGCKSRNQKPVWLIDGKDGYCNSCFERWSEVNFLDQHRIVRLSDEDKNFEPKDRHPRRHAPVPLLN